MGTNLNTRIDRLEKTKKDMDKPDKLSRLIYREGEEIPELPEPTVEEVRSYGPGGRPILIWDLD